MAIMKIGLIGLGRMGFAIADRLVTGGHEVIAFDPSQEARSSGAKLGIQIADSVIEVAQAVHTIWLMVPAGDTVDAVLRELSSRLPSESIVIDGGNSNFEKTKERAARLAEKNIYMLDCGTSGGLKGQEIGFSLMIGGHEPSFRRIESIFKSIATTNGYAYLGCHGAGHYVKMVHNGVEYAILQSYAEGLHLLKEGEYDLDLSRVTKTWAHGSVIRSWIADLLHEIFEEDQTLEDVSGAIGENSTGRWTLAEAKKNGVPMDLLERSLDIRTWSRQTGGNYGTKVVAMLRKKFGGHPLLKK